MLEILRARQASLEARAEMDKSIETPTDPEKRAMDLDAVELKAVKAEIEKLEKADDGITDITPEGREFSELEGRCSVGRIFETAVNHSASDGAERELQSELGLKDNMIPLALLREERAVTVAPGQSQQNAQPILMPIFASSAAAFLGIPTPRVQIGDAVYPTLTNRPDVKGPHTDSTSAGETTGSFSASVLSPSRLQASFFYRRTDAARFAGMDAALRLALQEGLGEALDKEIISGTNGLLTGTNIPDHDSNVLATYAHYVSNFLYSRVDGRYANAVGELRILMGSGTYSHAGQVYRSTDADRSALDRLIADSVGVRVSAHVPDIASTKQDGIIRLGNAPDMVAPIWEGIALISDEVTQIKKGEISITAIMMGAVKILRTAGFYKQQSKVSA